MPWFPVDDQFAFHRKAVAAGNAAIGLWTRAGSWSKGTLTDGFVPVEMARSLGTPAQAKALVSSGLWDQVEGGYRFHEWDERNDSKAEIEARRKADRDRKAARRKVANSESPPGIQPDTARNPNGIQPDTPPESERNPNGIQADSSLRARTYPTQPTPAHPFGDGQPGEGSHESIAPATYPPPRNCSKHPDGTTDRCGPCGDARRAREEWDRLVGDRATRERKSRRALIDGCQWCDDNGMRHEPPTLKLLDLPAVRCDHTAMSNDQWLALVPAEAVSHA